MVGKFRFNAENNWTDSLRLYEGSSCGGAENAEGPGGAEAKEAWGKWRLV